VGAGQPFEIVSQFPFQLQAQAHLDKTELVWLYWEEFRTPGRNCDRLLLETFRHQYQRKLFWLEYSRSKTLPRID
jgi:hypothetical protein